MFKIIAFEGIDGSGKTTISKIIYNFLKEKNYNVILTKEPFTKEISELIEKSGWRDPILLTLLFSADRALHIRWLLEQNPEIVIMDRYYYSTIAYQSVLGVEEDWIVNVNSKFPKPDITFLLDLNEEEALKRLKLKKNERFNFEEKLASLKLVRKKYLELARKYNFVVVDATDAIENITKKIISVICSTINLKCS